METEYITSDLLKNTLTLTGTTFADVDIAFATKSASRAIDLLCQRHFYMDDDTAQVRYYTPGRQTELEIDDLVTLTSLQTDTDGDGTFEQSWTLNTDFVLEPFNALSNAADPWPYTLIRVHPAGSYVLPTTGYPRTVKVTGKFGWPVGVPDAVVDATTLLANRLLTIKRSAPLGIVAFDGGAVRIARADQSVMMLVGNYMKHRVAVA